MTVWQVSYKKESGNRMELREFPSWWRAIFWIARNLKKHRIVMIVKIEEQKG